MQNKMNKVTEKVLEESKLGRNLKKFENIKELFEELGINDYIEKEQDKKDLAG